MLLRSDLVQEVVALQVLFFGIVEKQYVACEHSRGSNSSMDKMLLVCEQSGSVSSSKSVNSSS